MAWDGLKKFVFSDKPDSPDSLWMKCEGCGNLVYRKAVAEKLKTCPECNFHFSMTAQERIASLVDDGTFEELWSELAPADPLGFVAAVSYKEKVKEDQKITGLNDAAVVGRGKMNGREVVVGVTDSRFIMGSMGSVVGEKVARAAEKAIELGAPFIMVSGSGGGARMYEGCLSLMQMAKTSAAVGRLDSAGGLFISVLTNPTMAGVMASFASLGHVIIAEPKALIGFTGPRVIEQTIGKKLPPGFQRSEFLLEHGIIDMIVDRSSMKAEVSRLLEYWGDGPSAN
jgi:acetyl-CoA carboxylase carboxyl transferase subunit beta